MATTKDSSMSKPVDASLQVEDSLVKKCSNLYKVQKNLLYINKRLASLPAANKEFSLMVKRGNPPVDTPVKYTFSDNQRHLDNYAKRLQELAIEAGKNKKTSKKSELGDLTGINSLVYVGDAILSWLRNGDFGRLDFTDPKSKNLKECLPVLFSGYCSRSIFANLIYIYVIHNKLQDPNTKTKNYMDDVLTQAFRGDVMSSHFPHLKGKKIVKSPYVTASDDEHVNKICSNVFTAIDENNYLKEKELKTKPSSDVNENDFTLGHFQLFLSFSYFSEEQLEKCCNFDNSFDDIYSTLKSINDGTNTDLRQKIIQEAQLVKTVKGTIPPPEKKLKKKEVNTDETTPKTEEPVKVVVSPPVVVEPVAPVSKPVGKRPALRPKNNL